MRLAICNRCQQPKPQGMECDCGKQPDQQRQTTTERGYDGWWKRYSQDYRMRNPYCVCCAASGRITPANVVDHIVPFNLFDGESRERLRTNPSNHQSLCDGRNNQPDCHGRIKKPFEHRWRNNPTMLKIKWQEFLERLRLERTL